MRNSILLVVSLVACGSDQSREAMIGPAVSVATSREVAEHPFTKQVMPGLAALHTQPRLLARLAGGTDLPTAVTIALFERTDVDPVMKVELAGALIERGIARPEPLFVLQAGLLDRDRAVAERASAVIARVSHDIPDHMRPVFASLLREHEVSAVLQP